jgi:RHS repeat-associated protein
MGLTAGNDVLLFFYDQRGKVSAVDFNGTYYYYLRNGQGDIVKLIDNSGNTVVEYAYDTWGKQLSCTGTLASTLGVLNPFRYRGYVYDEETQWYYLQSRYYDPETCRFLSADVMLSTGQGVLGHNTYAYCLNNPVNMQDNSGHAANWAVSVMIADGGSGGKSIRYNVPLYNQGDTSLCWAYCQVMIESYREGEILTQTQADERAKQIAQEVFGSTDKNDWNQGNYPQDIIDGMWADEISCQDLYDLLVKHGPLYGFYGCEGGHYIVITGVNVSTNTVYTNNPWGSSNSQLFEDFLMGISFNDEFYEMQLETVWWTK